MPQPQGSPLELIAKAWEARKAKRPADARGFLVQAIAQARAASETLALAQGLGALGRIERDLGKRDAAIAAYEEAAAIFRAGGEELALELARVLRHLGELLREVGRRAPARAACVEALALYRRDERSSLLELANAIRAMALVEEASNDPVEATILWTEARTLYTATGVDSGVQESSDRITALKQKK